MSEASIQKAAILMLALGQNEAAEVLKYLEQHEVEKLGSAMSAMKSVSTEDLEHVLHDFHHDSIKQTLFGIDSENYIRHVLTKALGEDRGNNLVNRIMVTDDISGIERLKLMESKAIADLISQEHPQIIATIMVHLEPMQASKVLIELPENIRAEVLLRITKMDAAQPIALNELNDVLSQLLIGNEVRKLKPIDGIRSTASIINFLENDIESGLLSKLNEIDSEIAKKIKDRLFKFDDIVKLENEDIQIILRFIKPEALIIALKGSSEELKEKIFTNMTKRAADIFREDFEAKAPVKLQDIDKQQKDILQLIRRLDDEGQINLRHDGEIYFV